MWSLILSKLWFRQKLTLCDPALLQTLSGDRPSIFHVATGSRLSASGYLRSHFLIFGHDPDPGILGDAAFPTVLPRKWKPEHLQCWKGPAYDGQNVCFKAHIALRTNNLTSEF